MNENERLYIVKNEQGEEFGPLDREALIKYAENGRISPRDKVRSTIVPKWEKAIGLSFLKDILRVQEEAEVMAKANNRWARLRRQIHLEAETELGESGVVKLRLETFPSAGWFTRVMAALIDLLVLGAGGVLLILVFYGLLKAGVFTADSVAYFFGIFLWLWVSLYYAVAMACTTQTVGQRFWGIFLIRQDARPFFIGRAYAYTLLMLLFGWLTPLMVLIAGRGCQEIFTKTRMVKARLAGIKG